MILTTPLEWPDNTGITPDAKRRVGKFSSGGKGYVTMGVAIDRLIGECNRLGAKNVTLNAMFALTRTGSVSQAVARSSDQAVVLRFSKNGVEYTLPCDRYTTAEDNVAALAAHIEATRAIERHGVASTEQALQAFAALPPPSNLPAIKPKRDWWTVLGVFPTADAELIEAAYRVKAKQLHPDTGGDPEEFKELQVAIEEARRTTNGKV